MFASVLLLSSCSREEEDHTRYAEYDKAKGEPDQTSFHVKALFVDSSFTKAILYAGRARIFQERFETLLDSSVRVDFMSSKSDSRLSVLTADSARIDDRTKNMLARGRVKVVSDSSGTKLETSLLEWDNRSRKIYSTEFVRITSPTETLQGYGFESDPTLSNYKILRVSGEKR